MDVDWSQLPPDLLETIAKKLTIYIDYLRFRAVCTYWRSSVRAKPHHLPSQPPWLMIPHIHSKGNLRGFFSLTENKLQLLDLPEARYRRCCGSSHGWLAIVEEQSPRILLLNPLTKVQIQLPPITTFRNVLEFDIAKVGREYLLETIGDRDRYTLSLKEVCDGFIRKIVLSSSPADEEFVAVAVISETYELAFCKNGDSEWTMINGAQFYCEDIIFYNGLVYSTERGKAEVVICDVGAHPPIVTVIQPQLSYLFYCEICYLVDSFDELLLVNRHLEMDDEVGLLCETNGFEVFKLDVEKMKWVEVESLGDRALFVGGNSSVSLLASDFRGCKGNCIYFTDEYTQACEVGLRAEHDVGVFDISAGCVSQLPCYTGSQELTWPPHIWFTANPR